MTKSIKVVQFNLTNNKTQFTYSQEEYDRRPIDSILLRKIYNKINTNEWINEQNDLLIYKYCEMVVHKDSVFK